MAQERPEPSVPPQPPPGWTRCHAFLDNKGRFCRQQPKPLDMTTCCSSSVAIYCGNHQHLLSTSNSRKRIPCPLDPSHSIFEDAVEKHVSICPKLKKQRIEQESFYCRDVNTGGYGAIRSEASNSTRTGESLEEWAQGIALAVLETHQRLFATESSSNGGSVAQLTLDDVESAVPVLDLSDAEFAAGLADAVQVHRIKSGGTRHLHQQASLIGHLRRIGALPTIGKQDEKSSSTTKDVTVLEVGAGRGMMGLIAAGVQAASSNSTSSRLIMVERTGSRSKADTVLRQQAKSEAQSSYMNLRDIDWTRIPCDLSHVDMTKVVVWKHGDDDSSKKNKLVVIAKHLCGVGTDLALKSLEPIKESVHACVLATCCHGACNWHDYVGRDYLCQEIQEKNAIDFGAAEFELLRKWSAGSVLYQQCCKSPSTTTTDHNGNDNNTEQDEHVTTQTHTTSSSKDGTSVSAVVQALQLECGVKGLGRACQRLIDYGRLEYLNRKIFASQGGSKSELVCYVPPEITPQNAVLIARR